MSIHDLIARLGGEILSNKARAAIDGKVVILARMNGNDWVYTDEGQALANKHSNEVVAEAKTPRTRKAKDVPAEPVAVELADVEPEL
jgi:hypothetical protein